MENDIFNRVFKSLKDRRNRIKDGKINCIPWNLPRFEEENPGIEKGKYYLITGATKSAKTQIVDHLFMYNAFRQIKTLNLPVKLVIKYFSLEMSVEEKVTQFLCNLLFVRTGMKIIISSTNLRSTKKMVDEAILEHLSSEKDYIDEFLKCVEYIDSIRHGYGIFKHMQDYALTKGTQHKKIVTYNNETIEIDDYYEENDSEEYVLCIIDHISLLSVPTGGSLHQAIGDLSSKWLIQLRNKYKYIPVVIQQQAMSGESLDNVKANMLKPSLTGIGDNKMTARDANVVLGIYSPFRHSIPEYLGYNIKKLRDNCRFLEILASREGGNGTICPLYFSGNVNYFKELPKFENKTEMEIFYNILESNRENEIK